MHEVGIAQALVRTAERAAREAGLEHVSAMNVELGPRAGLAPEALAFALRLAVEDTIVRDADVVFSGPGAEVGDEAGAGHDHDQTAHSHNQDHDLDDLAALDGWSVRLAWIEGT